MGLVAVASEFFVETVGRGPEVVVVVDLEVRAFSAASRVLRAEVSAATFAYTC